ncbi:MAG: sigma-54 dependent transcriptional regulator [Candidatus Krumholzibacteria bacterium]|nr:sigma-54 dependent transcriptional regulator [Candidatus Krumholzibacteria bacterium]MDH4336276.1 sigma-54 dependent transcriptional regulator [Candidatus Krumholzibacteria bacterium]MDH5269685.1 sigma-54 dependent transcriptional regulator [Candidatus Krumholzibacteria bacterium]MDH5627060.1 sigma-54 dependent transcriptional regulator [Candidatus Krumholzibacteria bacterium]
MPRTILIADDEQGVRNSLQRLLEFESYRVVMATDGPSALAAVRDRPIDLALVDIKMPGMDGLEVLAQLHSDQPQLPVVIISGHGTIQTAVEATRLGAFDFVEKPIDADRLLLVIRNGLAQRRLLKENVTLKAAVRQKTQIVGRHPEIQKIMETIRKVAPANARVLIMGENGTGKEMVARALHELSPRAEEPFVEVNCAAIPEELIESELFGHERGAFTGAVGRRVGKFELADGGTLFLDEVGDMSLNAQAKVLRVLQESVFERVGGTETMRVDVRVIAATNKDLLKASREGSFREDLFYRLNVVPITVPPLRERASDIPTLVEYFLQQTATELGQAPRKVSRAAMERLQEYAWPGNVRELKNMVERLVILSSGASIEVSDLPDLAAAEKSEGRYFDIATYTEFRDAVEKEFLERKLRLFNHNVSKTARRLGMQRSNLYKKLEKFGIPYKSGRDDEAEEGEN